MIILPNGLSRTVLSTLFRNLTESGVSGLFTVSLLLPLKNDNLLEDGLFAVIKIKYCKLLYIRVIFLFPKNPHGFMNSQQRFLFVYIIML